MLRSLDSLSVYEWDTRTGKDCFCPICEILAFRVPSNLTKDELAESKLAFEGWAVNVRCLDGVDLTEILVVVINGTNLR